MDSKNLIWLSSFFSLLFITFCVTRHLDDLNPNIMNISNNSQEINSELKAIHLDNDDYHINAPKVEIPKVEIPKVEIPKVEIPKVEIPKVETTHILTTDDIEVALPTIKKVEVITEPIKTTTPIKVQKPKKVVSVKAKKVFITPSKTTKQQKKKTYTSYTIGKMYINDATISELNGKQNHNELNKLAYMHNINKDSRIQIVSASLHAANTLKRYLQTQNVKKQYIKIIHTNNNDNLTKITLTGRK